MPEKILPALAGSEVLPAPEKANPEKSAFMYCKPAAMKDPEIRAEILQILLSHGRLAHMRSAVTVTEQKIADHYADSQGKYYYPPMIRYMTDQQIDIFIWTANDQIYSAAQEAGLSVQEYFRKTYIGPSDAGQSTPGQIRNLVLKHGLPIRTEVEVPIEEQIDGGSDIGDNLIHCSDSVKALQREISIWYKDEPDIIKQYMR